MCKKSGVGWYWSVVIVNIVLYCMLCRYLSEALNNVALDLESASPDREAQLNKLFSYGLANELASLK